MLDPRSAIMGLGSFEFLAVLIALTFGTQDVGGMLSGLPDFAIATEAAKCFWELNRPPTFTGDPAQDPGKGEQRIKHVSLDMSDVHFSYTRDGPRVFSGVDLSFRRGQHAAIVGPSGSGKSTVLDLLGRFYTASSGHIVVENVEISSLNSGLYRSLVSICPQQSIMFNGSLRFNILLGLDSVSEERLEDAWRQADILSFIQSLPEGMDTLCGNSKLSVGQKQRLAIARSLVRSPGILLLEEPTNSFVGRQKRAEHTLCFTGK